MLDRCYKPTSHKFPRYGGRGIKVCERWHDFAAFIEDVGQRPEGMTLDRKNNDGDYEPTNVRCSEMLRESRDEAVAVRPTVGYFFNPKSGRKTTHLWDGQDTLCHQWSSGGMHATRGWAAFKELPPGRKICGLCLNKAERTAQTEYTPPQD